MPPTIRRTLPIIATIAAATALGGCIHGDTAQARRIRRNPTPELETLHQREVDVANRLALTFNENHRMLKQDLGRAFYTDRPSRLTPEPVPR